MKRGLILFAHGARAASWAVPFERLRDQTRERGAAYRFPYKKSDIIKK